MSLKGKEQQRPLLRALMRINELILRTEPGTQRVPRRRGRYHRRHYVQSTEQTPVTPVVGPVFMLCRLAPPVMGTWNT